MSSQKYCVSKAPQNSKKAMGVFIARVWKEDGGRGRGAKLLFPQMKRCAITSPIRDSRSPQKPRKPLKILTMFVQHSPSFSSFVLVRISHDTPHAVPLAQVLSGRRVRFLSSAFEIILCCFRKVLNISVVYKNRTGVG